MKLGRLHAGVPRHGSFLSAVPPPAVVRLCLLAGRYSDGFEARRKEDKSLEPPMRFLSEWLKNVPIVWRRSRRAVKCVQ
jgi:hypothetical protein